MYHFYLADVFLLFSKHHDFFLYCPSLVVDVLTMLPCLVELYLEKKSTFLSFHKIIPFYSNVRLYASEFSKICDL